MSNYKIKTETVTVTKKPRTLSGTWTMVEPDEVDASVWWRRIISRIYYWIGLPDPYCTTFYGVDVESELTKALIEEINESKNDA